MDQMPTRDHVMPEPLSRDISLTESRAIFERNTRLGAILLLILAAMLTALAVGADVRFAGFAALIIVFAGSIWFTYRALVARWARFRNLPISSVKRI